ncbi:hypothetical protein KFE25_013338 [Diacronema lutheri]|uniref:Ciliary microtubule inner protein 2A-C-like domain-containing protein n=2 Tax=Diacronema lutheri TaxID=2081491 RepID=A0A8J5XUM8_DIALT|nr:hypothetical protein KFE25_013338 [Diacronema lutheri]
MPATDLDHHVPGYTGYIPSAQHVLAMTFGQATTHLLKERAADDDPAKWRKHVSYAEFTPPRTPIEKHHIPGYSGFVPGVVADSGQLFGKTFGKMTLKAIKGEYEADGSRDRLTTVEKDMLADAAGSHPAESKDFKEGGSSWSGASPYRSDLDYEVGTIHPHQPQPWGLATGAEPWRESALVSRMLSKGRRDPNEERPSVRYYAKNDPCDPKDPEKRILSATPQPHHIPGYSGFMPGIIADSIYGKTYAQATHTAHALREEAESRPSTAHMSAAEADPTDGVIPYRARDGLKLRHSDFGTTARPDKPARISKHLPGYTGFIPGVISESMYGTTFPQQSIAAIEGDKERFHYKPLQPSAQYVSEVKDAFRNFGREVPHHLGTAHTDANANRMSYRRTPPPTKLTTESVHHHMPGYGGFVPGLYSKNVYGRTFYKASDMALGDFEAKQATLQRPSTAPEQPPVFRAFVPTLRMQGGDGLKAKNKSSIALADEQIASATSYATTSALEFGPKERLVKTPYPKNPLPDFVHFGADSGHPSMYNGYHAR